MGGEVEAGGCWVDALDNPEAVRPLLEGGRDAGAIDLHEVLLERDGPLLRLRFALPFAPPVPARRGREATGTSGVQLAAWEVEDVRIEGWARQLPGRLVVRAGAGLRTLVFEGEGCSVQARFARLRAEEARPSMAPRILGPDAMFQAEARPMDLYEVVRWGNDSDDPVTGGGNGPDTCFLVHATSVEEAAAVVDYQLSRKDAPDEADCASLVQLLGSGHRAPRAQVVRGPYVQSAYGFGLRRWSRIERGDPWVEVDPAP
ncbi:hypothetical protein [Pseudoxanthomonas sp. 10H]|uniref:hypothetical protein n=1 Tax=Pseudoxanthomonas sp. 10H TaxID=3242729 RepID=UPI00355753E1